MRVLYVVDTFPTASESYIRAEMEYVLAQGVEVAVAARTETRGGYPTTVVGHYTGTKRACEAFKPDLVHVHWMNLFDRVADLGLPVTVRGHSFEFNPAIVREMVMHPNVHRVFVFPSQRIDCPPSSKLVVLPCAYDPARYFMDPAVAKRPLVFRAAAGLPGKDLESFIRIAAYVKKTVAATFVLAVTTPVAGFARWLHALNDSAGKPVELRENLTHDECARLMQEAAVYFRSHDPTSHPYGMPISIAEAMACGCRIVARAHYDATRYIGPAGECFDTDAEAVCWIGEGLKATPEARRLSVEQAQQYRTDRVLPTLINAWKEIAR